MYFVARQRSYCALTAHHSISSPISVRRGHIREKGAEHWLHAPLVLTASGCSPERQSIRSWPQAGDGEPAALPTVAVTAGVRQREPGANTKPALPAPCSTQIPGRSNTCSYLNPVTMTGRADRGGVAEDLAGQTFRHFAVCEPASRVEPSPCPGWLPEC